MDWGSSPIEAAMLIMYALRILQDVFCKHTNITEKKAFVDFSKTLCAYIYFYLCQIKCLLNVGGL